nr:MAG TPA: hypothetical protein [Caudoviricetes sp.]
MAEYIELEAAFNAITDLAGKASTRSAYEAIWKSARALKKIPTADVAPVVRCKDCKHFNHKRMECENEAISTDHEGGAQYSLNFWPDDFCSYGEPKEGTNADDHD